MRVIGLVGGIGSGKSTAAAMLSEMGGLVLDADSMGHQAYRSGSPGHAAVVTAFGPEVVGSDGEIDRKRLGAIVFGNPARLAELNAIVHPLIRAQILSSIDEARRAERARFLVLEAAILLEAGWRDLVDEVWVVTAGRDRVLERLQAQRGLAPADTAARIARQMTDGERRAQADVVVENTGTLEDLRRALAGLHRERLAG